MPVKSNPAHAGCAAGSKPGTERRGEKVMGEM